MSRLDSTIARSDIFAVMRTLHVMVLALNTIADHAAEKKDVEGEIADVTILAKSQIQALDRAIG